MLTFRQYLSEMYSEPDDSTVTDNGYDYDLNGLLSATLGMERYQFPVHQLTWIFQWDNPFKDSSRVSAADVTAPILVTKERNRLVVLDGLHRVAKAMKDGDSTIEGIFVPDELMRRYRLPKARL